MEQAVLDLFKVDSYTWIMLFDYSVGAVRLLPKVIPIRGAGGLLPKVIPIRGAGGLLFKVIPIRGAVTLLSKVIPNFFPSFSPIIIFVSNFYCSRFVPCRVCGFY